LADLKIQPSDPSTWDVLLVDDEADNLTVLELLLEFNGVRVTAARSGQEAIELFRQRAFTLVLMDIQMPLVSGWDVIKQIRASEKPAVRSMLVIAVTAHAMHGDRERVMTAGFDGYISKPVNVSILMANLKAAVQRHCTKMDAGEVPHAEAPVPALESAPLEPKVLLAEQKPSVNGHGPAAEATLAEPPITQEAETVDPSAYEDKPEPLVQERASSQAQPASTEPKVAEEVQKPAAQPAPSAASEQHAHNAHADDQKLHVAGGKDQ
jgi:CheY-like chemotaxis protein